MNMPGGERGFASPQNQHERQPKIVTPEQFRAYEADLYAKEAQRREVGHQVLGTVDVKPPVSETQSYESAYEAAKARILAMREQPRQPKFGEPKINTELPAHMRRTNEGTDLSEHAIRATVQANKHQHGN